MSAAAIMRGTSRSSGADGAFYGSAITAANHYDSAASGGEAGSSSGFGVFGAVYVTSTGNQTFYSRFQSGQGYLIDVDSGNLRIVMFDSGGAAKTAVYALTAPDLNKYLAVHGWYDSVAGKLYLAVGGVIQAISTMTSYLTAAAQPTMVGRRSDAANPSLTATRYVGFATWTGNVTAAEIGIHAAQCMSANDALPMAGAGVTSTHWYSFRRSRLGPTTPPSPLTDLVGSSNLTKTGTPTLALDAAPSWLRKGPFAPVVYLFVGDSRIAGSNTATKPGGFPPGDDTLWMCKSDTLALRRWVQPDHDQFAGLAGTGPGGFFGWYLNEETGQPVVVINAGRGGLRSDEWLSGTAAYIAAMARVQAALAWPGAEFGGFICDLGWNNAAQNNTVDYAADMTAMKASFRSDIGAAATGKTWIQVRLQTNQAGAHYDVVRAAQAAMDGVDDVTVVQEPYNIPRLDAAHPETEGFRITSRRFLGVTRPTTAMDPDQIGGHTWLRGDDAVSVNTLGIVDRIAGRVFAGPQTKPTYQASLSEFGNLPAMRFGGSAYLVSQDTAATWQFLHDGTGMEVYIISCMRSNAVSNQMWMSTMGTSLGSLVGMNFRSIPGASVQGFAVCNNAPFAIVNNTTQATGGQDAAGLVGCRYKETTVASEWASVYVENEGVFGSSGNAPSAVAPTNTLHIGGGGGSSLLIGDIAELVIFDRFLSSLERRQLRLYFESRYPSALSLAV